MGCYVTFGDHQVKKGSEEYIFSVSSIERQIPQNSSSGNIKKINSNNNICRLLGLYV
jgi:hypothetical protein